MIAEVLVIAGLVEMRTSDVLSGFAIENDSLRGLFPSCLVADVEAATDLIVFCAVPNSQHLFVPCCAKPINRSTI